MSLRRKKERFRELESLIQQEAEQLSEPMQKRQREVEYVSRLSRECEIMETEIAMLKNKRSPTERITLDQALQTVDQQVAQISEYGQRTIEAEKELKELRPKIKLAKLGNEKLSNTVGGLEREKREREEKGGGIDERAEQGCEWCVTPSPLLRLWAFMSADPQYEWFSRIENATKLYKKLLGIDETYTVGRRGSTPGSIVISFNTIKGNIGGKRSLTIDLGPDGRMSGAKVRTIYSVQPSTGAVRLIPRHCSFSFRQLIDSSQSIQDLVDIYLPSQDIRGLVQEVKTRIIQR